MGNAGVDNFGLPGDPIEPERNEHCILIHKYEDSLEDAIAASLIKHHTTMYFNKSKHIRNYPWAAIDRKGDVYYQTT